MGAGQLTTSQRWSILAGAAILLSLAMGMRQSFGLFQPSIIRDVGITVADFSLATALQNVVWGVTQPVVGMLADRYGSRYVMLGGVLVYAAGLVIMMFTTSALMFIVGAGFCVVLELSCTASSITMALTSRVVLPAQRRFASLSSDTMTWQPSAVDRSRAFSTISCGPIIVRPPQAC